MAPTRGAYILFLFFHLGDLAPTALHTACGCLWENNAPAALHTVGGETMAPTRGAYILFLFFHLGDLAPTALHTACGCLWENNAPAALHTVGGETMAPTRGAYILFLFFHSGDLAPTARHTACGCLWETMRLRRYTGLVGRQWRPKGRLHAFYVFCFSAFVFRRCQCSLAAGLVLGRGGSCRREERDFKDG